jgi:hypothetical protein
MRFSAESMVPSYRFETLPSCHVARASQKSWAENREYPAHHSPNCSTIILSLNRIVERQTIRRGRCIRILTGAKVSRLRDQQCSRYVREGKDLQICLGRKPSRLSTVSILLRTVNSSVHYIPLRMTA